MRADCCRRCWYPLLGGILCLALFLRWPWPAPSWEHMDEAAFIVLPLGFWSGDLNPHFFNYPSLPFYLTSLAYYLYYLLCSSDPLEQFVAYRFFVDGHDLLAVARGLHTLMAVGTVAVSAFVGRRLYGAAGGLLAGLFLAVMPLPVRFAHLAITDTPAVLWVSLALLWAVRIRQEGRRLDYAMAGLFVGLAGATKYPAALVAVPVATAALLRKPSLKQAGLWCSGAAAVLVFCVVTPYVWLDAPRFWADFTSMGQDHLLSTTRAALPSWLHHLWYSLRYGLGTAGLVLLFWALLRSPRAWPHEELIVASGVAAFYLLLTLAGSVFMRYALPLAPFLALLMVRPLIGRSLSRGAWAAILAVLLAEPVYSSLQTRRLLSGDDTRAQAVRWIDEHLPGTRLLVNLPEGCGNVGVVTPEYIHVRETHFRQSYGLTRLGQAYALLGQRHDLPPLYLVPGYHAMADRVAPAPGSAPGAKAVVLWYQDPLCSAGQIPPEARYLLDRCAWQQTFSPGRPELAVYDPVDWFFLPMGAFGKVERTGPTILLGTLPLRDQAGTMDLRSLFLVLHDLLQGHERMLVENWSGAVRAYGKVLAAPIPLEEFLPLEYRYYLHANMAAAHNHLGRPADAVPRLESAIALKPDRAELYNDLGVAQATLGHMERAIQAWEQAVRLDPGHAMAYLNLGRALYQLGHYGRARACLERALELVPDHPLATQIRTLLERH